jgi:hypothetical protein|tara:strand:- start:43 stop:525 length:483 start_codon:yes stop_codon:yes gene_type:complete
MAHLNILQISREIENINKNINVFQENLNNNNNTTVRMSTNINDLNQIKSNKIDIDISLEEIRQHFKYLENKVNLIHNNVNIITKRNMDYINAHNMLFVDFLKSELKLNKKQINIIIYVLECSTPQDFLLINSKDLIEFGFTEYDISKIKQKCKEDIESTV